MAPPMIIPIDLLKLFFSYSLSPGLIFGVPVLKKNVIFLGNNFQLEVEIPSGQFALLMLSNQHVLNHSAGQDS